MGKASTGYGVCRVWRRGDSTRVGVAGIPRRHIPTLARISCEHPWIRVDLSQLRPAAAVTQRAYGLELIKIDSNREAGFRDYSLAGGTAASGERFPLG